MFLKNKKSFYCLGIVIMLVSIIYCFFCPNDKYEMKKAMELIAVGATTMVAVIIIEKVKINEIVKKILSVAVLIFSPYFIIEFIFYDRTIKTTENLIFDILIIALLMCMVLVFCRRTAVAIISVCVFSMLFVVFNEMIISFRKTAITPTDIFSFGTALAVSGQYKFVFTYKMLMAIMSGVSWSILALKTNIRLAVPNRGVNIALTAIPLALLITGVLYISKAEIKGVDQFDISASNKNAGTATTFVFGVKSMYVSAPENYSADKAKEILSQFQPTENADFTKPDVVVVMNEALSDLSTFVGIGDEKEYMPFLSSMQENVQKGYAQVSVFGGNTCNTEFEFLTGSTLAFLPNGYIPYMRTLTSEIPSICNDFAQYGYSTTAIHPYMPQCWRRNIVYPLLGFDRFISGEDFDPDYDNQTFKMRGSVDFGDLKYIRKYVSDEENYNMVLKQLNSREIGESKFIFNVTMQNHGPYTYKGKDFDEYLNMSNITIDECDNKDEVLQYLTLIKESDKAFEGFIKKLEQSDRPTVVVMFGDHLPGLKAVNDNLKGKSDAEKQAKYYVPYYIWANFDIPEKTSDSPVAMSYLSNELKNVIGMPLTDWDNLRESVRAEYPSINAYGAFDMNYQWHKKTDENETFEPESDILNKYEIVQYGRIFKGSGK